MTAAARYLADESCAVTPLALAQCRRLGTVSDLPLHTLAGRATAEAFQMEAIRLLGGEPCGYKVGATSPASQQLLKCRQPIFGPILPDNVLSDGARFPLPAGVLGIECEYGFLMGRDFPIASEVPSIGNLKSAIFECFASLEIVGRRVGAQVPLNEASAIADFALNVTVVRGEPIPKWQSLDLAAAPVIATVGGMKVASGSGAAVLGHPLNALLWLANALRARGRTLRKWELVLTGSCTGITRIAPGQTFTSRFGGHPRVQVQLA
jgi:2-keto-4-pentenoate hydratase